MTLRPVDENGDILPVLASYLSTYIRQTEGVQELDDVAFSVDGRTFRYSCRAMTAEGETEVEYAAE